MTMREREARLKQAKAGPYPSLQFKDVLRSGIGDLGNQTGNGRMVRVDLAGMCGSGSLADSRSDALSGQNKSITCVLWESRGGVFPAVVFLPSGINESHCCSSPDETARQAVHLSRTCQQ
jgi:hypothetical protein